MKIRLAQIADTDAVYALARSFATSFVVEEHIFRHSFSELIVSAGAYLAVAEVQEQIVGYVLGFVHYTLYANGRVAWVEEIMVSEALRRQGIGQHLMAEFEVWAAYRGCELIALATRRASAFYASLGYEESAAYFRNLL